MFSKGDLVLIVAGDAPVQAVVEKMTSPRIVEVRTSIGTQRIFSSGLRLIKKASKEVLVICEAATDKCAEMGCPHGKPHVSGVLGDCSHTRFKCQRSHVTGVTRKIRCKKVQ